MHATQLLDKHLRRRCQATHARRMDAVMAMVQGLLRGKTLTVTGLGRSLVGGTSPKHQIKKADRLIGNPHLHSEREALYRALTALTVGSQKRPVVIVDWSDLSPDGSFHKLRASLPVGGRALTLYEEVHSQRYVGNRDVHKCFLQTLKRLLPQDCRPVVVTDAGFRNPWFRSVTQVGWDFVGRVGGHTMICPRGHGAWQRVERVFATATGRARYYGEVELARNDPLPGHAYLLKRTPTGRIKNNQFGAKSARKHSVKNAHRERTPWLLITSLPGDASTTKAVVRLYRSRMQIEEAFRDLKNHRFGFCFRDSLTRKRYRLENLLLIGALAMLAAWLVGKVAELKHMHRKFQANTVRSRAVLSLFYLGCEVIASNALRMTQVDYNKAIQSLTENRYVLDLLD